VSGLFVAYAATGGIRAQRVNPDGTLAWATPPIVSTSSAQPEVEPDGVGGSFVSWTGSGHVFVKHVLSTGLLDPAWPSTGVDLGTSSAPRLVRDGQGGVYVAYSATADLYAIRLANTGAASAGWAGGRALVVAPGGQGEHVAASDGSGGLLVAWTDGRDAATSATDIYVTRFDAGGSPASGWAANGTHVCGAPEAQRRPTLAADGTGGALVAWIDGRNQPDCSGAGCGEDVFMSRVLSTGALDSTIPADGKAVSEEPGDQSEPVVLSGGPEVAIVAWLDGSLVPDGDPAWLTQVLAQRIDIAPSTAAGPPLLADGLGRPEPNPASESTRLNASLASDHPGGEIRVAVFDITGRLVRSLYSGPAAAGRRAIVWNLRTGAGTRVHSGLYFMRMTSPAGVSTRGVVVR
jgi:hypothetical protein